MAQYLSLKTTLLDTYCLQYKNEIHIKIAHQNVLFVVIKTQDS